MVTYCDTTAMEAATNIFAVILGADACTGHALLSGLFIGLYIILFAVTPETTRKALLAISAIMSFIGILMAVAGWITWPIATIAIIGFFVMLILYRFLD